MIILGIDPGTRIVGYGVLDKKGTIVRVQDYGVIKVVASDELPKRLKGIYQGLQRLIKQVRPDMVVVEDVFYAKDVRATIKMGEGRGVVLLCAALKNIPLYEYTPAEVKKSVTGNGRADKSQVQKMVKHILGLKEIPKPDEADALAIALCHTHRI